MSAEQHMRRNIKEARDAARKKNALIKRSLYQDTTYKYKRDNGGHLTNTQTN